MSFGACGVEQDITYGTTSEAAARSSRCLIVKLETPICGKTRGSISRKHRRGSLTGTHSLDFARFENLDHRLPCLGNAGSLDINHDLLALAILALLSRRHGLAGREVSRPVNEVEVKVARVELLEGVVKVGLHKLGTVGVAPELGDEEQLLARNTSLPNALGDLSEQQVSSEAQGRAAQRTHLVLVSVLLVRKVKESRDSKQSGRVGGNASRRKMVSVQDSTHQQNGRCSKLTITAASM